MTPIVKDVETSTATSSPALSSNVTTKNSQETAQRSQPMPLEVQVTVNGARTIEGTDKREPFSESTKTVLVFANGAVIRLASSVAAGQLLFVTNEKSKKEVVCQVLKSRNDGKATGYVELEFTEPVAGFWGVRIPGEGVGAQAPATLPKAPVAAPRAVTPAKIESPTPPTVLAPKIAVVPPPAPVAKAPIVPAALPSNPAVVVAPPAVVTAAKPEAVQASISTNAQHSEQPQAKVTSRPETTAHSAEPVKEISNEELRQQAARLQEQLNALLFREAAAEKATLAVPSVAALEQTNEVSDAPEIGRQVLELTEAEAKPSVSTETAKVAPMPLQQAPVEAKQTPLASKTTPISLSVEEVKIPSWLAPLAREAESTVEEATTTSDVATGTMSTLADAGAEGIFQAGAEEGSQKSEAVIFGGQLLGGAATTEAPSSGSKKGLLLGLAATVALFIGGGVWYGKQSGNFLATNSTASQVSENGRPAANESAERTDAATQVSGASSSATQSGTASKQGNNPNFASKTTTPTAAPAASTKVDNHVAHNTPPVEEPKKPLLGDVRLATPNVNRTGDSQVGEGAPSIDSAQATPASDSMSGITSTNSNGPVAPLPVGGDVKPAHLLKSTSPVYPPTARSQRISGNVTIDALIDASGAVTSTKVISGPTMLHQAAMTAVKQWKYEPAQLDGKPTAMHLTVTVQFHLQ